MSKKSLKLIGHWIERLDDLRYPPPQELVADFDLPAREAISTYLDAGVIVARYDGNSWCRFGCQRFMGGCALTDGEWVWPDGLSHYVRDHHVRLPNEFLAAVARNSPSTAGVDFESHYIRNDDSFWKEWCVANRSHTLRPLILAARDEIEIALADELARFRKIVEAKGVSDVRCETDGCQNGARSGTYRCPDCIVQSYALTVRRSLNTQERLLKAINSRRT